MDFEVFSISGPVGSAELFGGTCSIDTFSVQSPESSLVPIICGENSNSHSNDRMGKKNTNHFFQLRLFSVFVDIGSQNDEASLVSLVFTFTGRAVRRWVVKNTFIECSAMSR